MSIVTWQLTDYSWSYLVTSTPYTGVAYTSINPGAPTIEQFPGNPEIGTYAVKAEGPHAWLVNEAHCPILTRGQCGQTDLTTVSFAKVGYWSEPLGQNQFLVGWTPPYHAAFASAPAASVPEASTWLMLTLGLAALLCGRRLAAVRVR